MIKRLRLLIFILSICLVIFGAFTSNFNIIFISIMLLLLNNIVFALESIGERAIFIGFNISFFTLLLGRYLKNVFDQGAWTQFPASITVNTLMILYISLLSVFIGTAFNGNNSIIKKSLEINKFFEKLSYYIRNLKNRLYSLFPNTVFKVQDTKLENKNELIIYIRKISKLLFYFSYFFIMAKTIETAVYVQMHGYLSLYTDFHSKLPYIFTIISQMNTVFIYIFLSAFPIKRDLKIPSILYFLYLALSILTGERGTFVTGCFVILSYLVMRQHINNDEKEMYINYKVLIIIAPFIIVFLGAYNILRNKQSIESFNFFKTFIQFFVDQGGSSDIISYVQVYKDKLFLTNYNYTFGPIINYFKYGTIARLINGASAIKYNTINSALYDNNLGSTISYLVLKNGYLSGQGIGTQYIAEVYADFGYFGIIIYNLIIGIVIRKITEAFKKKTWFWLTLGLLICNYLFYLPRGSALSWIMSLLSIRNMTAILLTFFISYFYCYNHNKHREEGV